MTWLLMRRGFKSEARELATELREEVGLTPKDPLDPWKLAGALEIPVWSLSSYGVEIPEAVRFLSVSDTGAFSAMLAFNQGRRVVIHNDSHAFTRQRADISHELAHAALLHSPHTAVDGRAPHFDNDQEDEAKWLGSVLLVTDEFCLACCRDEVDLSEAARAMGVSRHLMRWRLNMSGAARRVTRARAQTR